MGQCLSALVAIPDYQGSIPNTYLKSINVNCVKAKHLKHKNTMKKIKNKKSMTTGGNRVFHQTSDIVCMKKTGR